MTTQNVMHKGNIYRVTFAGAVCTKVDRWEASHGWLLTDEQEYSEVVYSLSKEVLHYER